jgi:hypothetical protein
MAGNSLRNGQGSETTAEHDVSRLCVRACGVCLPGGCISYFFDASFPISCSSYGVRGIPFFVVLDAMSGQVVIPGSQSRTEIMLACRGGELSIETMLATWMERIPAESQEMLKLLELSCESIDKNGKNDKESPYLVQQTEGSKPATVLDSIKVQLVQEGGEPTAAAVKAMAQAIAWTSVEDTKMVLLTALKYLGNAKEQPWTPRFRTFKLGNKVADRITRVQGGLGLLQSIGFEVYGTSQDFMATIPLDADLIDMYQKINRLLL